MAAHAIKPAIDAYTVEQKRQLGMLLRDRTVLFKEGLSFAWYVVWWLLILPWGFIVPAGAIWLMILQGDAEGLTALLSGGWRELPPGPALLFWFVVTSTTVGLRPYRSVILETLRLRMHDWVLLTFQTRTRLAEGDK